MLKEYPAEVGAKMALPGLFPIFDHKPLAHRDCSSAETSCASSMLYSDLHNSAALSIKLLSWSTSIAQLVLLIGGQCHRAPLCPRHSPRTSRFGSPLVLSRVHSVRPELVAEVKYLTWTGGNLLR